MRRSFVFVGRYCTPLVPPFRIVRVNNTTVDERTMDDNEVEDVEAPRLVTEKGRNEGKIISPR